MLVTTILIILLSPVCFRQPPCGERSQRFFPQKMKLESALALSLNETGSFKGVQVLRNSLARCADLMLHEQPRAKFKEGLPISLAQFV
jgi:hypothetical protein